MMTAMLGASANAADRWSRFRDFDAESAAVVDHATFGAFLARHVRAGADGATGVAYAGVTPDDRAALGAYVETLQAIDPETLGRNEAVAYWINLYNALTLAVVIDHYPVASIRKIKSGPLSIGPWGRELASVAGAALSLNDIEHKILRGHFGDARIHYALNCASIGCPDLKAAPWTGASLDADLDAAARGFVNSRKGARFDGDRLVLSSIYDWYAKDFGATARAVLAHVAGYAEPDLRARLLAAQRVKYDYDWSLNEAK